MKKHLTALVVAAFLPLSAMANLLSNAGFEDLFTVWNFSNSASIHGLNALNPTHSGLYAGYVNAYPGYGEMSQTVATIVGHTYDVEFWLSSNGGGGFLYSSFAGTTGLNELDPPMGYFTYTRFSYSAVATDVLSTFVFGGHHITATFFIDDVSIVDRATVAGVPEAGNLLTLLGAGVLLAVLISRKITVRPPE